MAVGFPTKSNWSAGDVLTASGMDDLAGTLNYLSPVGQANGSTLVANSANASGLGWTSGNPIPNPVLNSAFQIAQRGTSIAVAAGVNAYTLDRWMYGAGGANSASTITRQSTNDTTNLPNIQYCARVQRNSGQTGTTGNTFSQSFETINSIPFVGKTVTFSFYARAGANYSPTSNALVATLYSGTSTDGNIQTGPWTGIASVASTTATLTTTWQRFTASGTVGISATQLSVYFLSTPTGTAGANDYYEITGVQIDIGSVALPFRTNGTTLQGESAACQRYYTRTISGGAFAIISNSGFGVSSTQAQVLVQFPVTMRTIPSTSLDYGGALRLVDGTNSYAATTLTASNPSNQNIAINVNTASGITQYRQYALSGNNDVAAYIGFSAELQ